MTIQSPTAPIRSVLIVRLSAIGDVIHALPVLDALRQALPEAKLGWVVEELSAPLLEGHPQLDKLYVIPKKRWKKYWHALYFEEIRPFFRQVKADGWDAVIDLHGLTKSGLVSWMTGTKLRVGYGDHDGRELNKLFTNRKVKPPQWAEHVVERNLSLLEGLGIIAPKDTRGVLALTDEEREAMRGRLCEAGWNGEEPLLAINPGAGWASKLWPTAYYAELGAAIAKKRKMRPLVLWGPGEEEIRDAVAEALRMRETACLLAPPTSVRELAALISLCTMFVGGDTGPTHMAGMLGVHTLSIFGASDAKRNRPWPRDCGPAVQDTGLWCVPCWKTVCPLQDKQHMLCMHGLKPGRVVEEAVDLIDGRRLSSGTFRRL